MKKFCVYKNRILHRIKLEFWQWFWGFCCQVLLKCGVGVGFILVQRGWEMYLLESGRRHLFNLIAFATL